MVRKIRISYTNGCYLAVTFFKSMKGPLIEKKMMIQLLRQVVEKDDI